jgi:hypothetical protein
MAQEKKYDVLKSITYLGRKVQCAKIEMDIYTKLILSTTIIHCLDGEIVPEYKSV